ncbi:MAG: hypothetical protein KAR25_03855 [Methanosarcinales archaeon]|nr:hypothetical protein [Methanosarcinales archaeon]
MRWTQNKFTKALGISIIIAFGMVSDTFGVISIFAGGGDPATIPAMRLAFAIVFVTGSVFFEARGADWNRIAVSSIPHLRRLI